MARAEDVPAVNSRRCGRRRRLAAGALHALLLLESEEGSSEVLTFGCDQNGRRTVPRAVLEEGQTRCVVAQVAAGAEHVLYLLKGKEGSNLSEEGSRVLAAGWNLDRQCDVHGKLRGGCRVTDIAAGFAHSLALFDIVRDKSCVQRIAAFGSSSCGQTDVRDVEEKLKGRRVVQLSAGGNQSLFLLEDGSLYGLGTASLQLRRGFKPKVAAVEVAAGTFHSLVLLADGTVQAFEGDDIKRVYGNQDFGQCRVPSKEQLGRKVVQVAAGGRHSMLLLEDGDVVAFGDNRQQQCNVPTDKMNGRRAVEVAAGMEYSLILLEDGELLAFGSNTHGQLDVPSYNKAHAAATARTG